jgi:hypothetical protein
MLPLSKPAAADRPEEAELPKAGPRPKFVHPTMFAIELTRARDVGDDELDIVDAAIVGWVAHAASFQSPR